MFTAPAAAAVPEAQHVRNVAAIAAFCGAALVRPAGMMSSVSVHSLPSLRGVVFPADGMQRGFKPGFSHSLRVQGLKPAGAFKGFWGNATAAHTHPHPGDPRCAQPQTPTR
jgi:hypothetical protein